MIPEWAKEAIQTAKNYPVVPSGVVIRLVEALSATIREKETESSEVRRLQAHLHHLQASLENMIRQLQECRDTEATVLRAVTESMERRSGKA